MDKLEEGEMHYSCYYNNRDWQKDYEKVCNHSIGQGTFGKVSLVRSRITKAQYAMKEIDLRQHILKSSLINRSYALDEGLKLIKLDMKHENIISYHRAYIYNEHIFWIMDYCDGGTLRERISLYAKQNRFLEENLIWYWALHILQGIKYIHSKGLVHRDLKPDNVYIHGKRGLCKIGDFGFAKLVVDSSMTQNTTMIKHFADERTTTTTDERVAYKLINMSQVGTPSYIAPELRMLIDCHLNFSSVETINDKIKLCERFIYKGDIFSFGCILYELTFLRLAFENRFQLPNDVYIQKEKELSKDENYSNELRNLIKTCLEMSPGKRPNIKQVMQMPQVESRLRVDFEEYYRKQVTPSLTMSSKKDMLSCKSATLEADYKPRAMKSLKFNQNLIVILAVRTGSDQTSDDESKIFIYNEFGELLRHFNSYLSNEVTKSRKPFSFAAYDMCVDEEYNHLYLSTRKNGIMRFRIVDTNYYFEDLTLDGCLDLCELYACRQSIQQQQQEFELFPTCLTLVEDESVFKDTVKITKRRRLIFYDRTSKQIVSIQTDLTSNRQHLINGMQHPSIKCDIYAGLTLDQTFPVRQMVSTSRELICLFDDLNVINVYHLKTLLIARTNQQVSANGRATSESLRKNIMCLTLDSNGSLYSTNGKLICNLDYGDFKQRKRVSPFINKGEPLAHTISWITILTNSKLVLLTDALQMEPSTLYILKPVNSKHYDGL